MAEARIPVDLFNPGQVFACLGLMETAEGLLGEVEGGFTWSQTSATFTVRAPAGSDPFEKVLAFLREATVEAIAPAGSGLSTEKWGVPSSEANADSFPFPLPASPATLPARLRDSAGHLVPLDYWGDETARDNVKFWGGSAGYPGAALARDALDLVLDRLSDPAARADPFNLGAPQSSSFRLDFRRDYIPIDTGFSLNAHARMTPRGYPLVELLAAIGLQNARPTREEALQYTYTVVGAVLPVPLLRAALGGAALPWLCRRFRMRLGWPGQAGQARCITSVSEVQP